MDRLDELLKTLPRVKTNPITVSAKAEPVAYAPSEVPTKMEQSVPPTPSVTVSAKAEPVAYAPSQIAGKLDQPPSVTIEPPPEISPRPASGAPPVGVFAQLQPPEPPKKLQEAPALPPPPAIRPHPPDTRLSASLPGNPPSVAQPPSKGMQLPPPPELPHNVQLSLPAAFKILPKPKALKDQRYEKAAVPKAKQAPPPRLQSTSAARAFPFSPLREQPRPTGNKVVVSLPDKKVIVYDPWGKILREYGVYVGTKKDPTPRGQFRIMENIRPVKSESYYGPRWIGFAHGYDEKNEPGGYAGFHGWVYSPDDDAAEREEPGWKTTTHGCVQMANKDVEDFGKLVGAGDVVTIVDQPLPHPTVAKVPELKPVPLL